MNKVVFANYKSWYLRRIVQIIARIVSSFIPVCKNRVFLCSYSGKQYSCCPKYIAEYLQKYYPGQFEIIFVSAGESFDKVKPEWLDSVRRNSLRYFYYLMSSKVLITNNSASRLVPKKKEQILINTWHGGGPSKLCGKPMDTIETMHFAHKERIYNANNTTAYVSSSDFFTESFIRESYEFYGDVIASGLPRNDIFYWGKEIQQTIKEKVFNALGIDGNCHILLYAPTMHDNTYLKHIASGNSTELEEEYSLDVEPLIQAARERFGGEWKVAFRVHFGRRAEVKDTIDASAYPDMQELLLAADILVTDYSSSMYDYSFTNRPCFLYAYDLKDFTDVRSFYWPIRTWGFPVCETEASLIEAIRNFNEEDYKEKMKEYHNSQGTYEDGHSTEKVVDYIMSHL